MQARQHGVVDLNLYSSRRVRVVSGMRPTGALHLGHYYGVLKNWLGLQDSHECFFFVADWHALTTHYDEGGGFASRVFDMLVDWLACGINPGAATLFVQSQIVEHAELHLLLSMITSQNRLERVPSYKDQQTRLHDRDLTTYGFLGYPLLQSADILIYKAGLVPVGEDQVAHIELTREIARRFNHIYGREGDFEKKVNQALDKLGKKTAKLYRELRRKFQEQGDTESFKVACALIESQSNISKGDNDRLIGYLEGGSRIILPEPEAMLTSVPKVPGVDGDKMSKSYNNMITLREPDEQIEAKIKSMKTDPARVKRRDPGDPEKCPVWQLHQIYSDQQVRQWVVEGCTTAGIGCLDCKQPVIDKMKAEIAPIRERAQEYAADRVTIEKIVAEGNEAARDVAKDTLEEVRQVMGMEYR